MKLEKEWKVFGGMQRVFSHQSEATGTRMEFAVFEPPKGAEPPMILYFLSGLTCSWENFVTKAGAQRAAVEHNVLIVCPDTSPRGEGVPDRPEEYDLGQGAGFYLNATEAPWSQHFKMRQYIESELPGLVEAGRDVSHRAISGHSMGGHGALTLGISNPEFYHSVSAFSPVVAPCRVPWGQKAFAAYLGEDREPWADHDACRLVETRGYDRSLLIDQGEADTFLKEQLRPDLFEASCKQAGVHLQLRLQPGYDHSYYFIATFIGEHLAWHRDRRSALSGAVRS
jgi:S-formylglutathione hydrolase